MRAVVLALALVCASTASAQYYDVAEAEAYYQKGMQAQQLSESAFNAWVQTINVQYVDIWRDRWQFALDMYENATRLNPAHWRAHWRAGQIYAEGAGSQANDLKALQHLVSYLALAPDHWYAERAKLVVDRLLARIIELNGSEHRRSEAAIAVALEDADALSAVRSFAVSERGEALMAAIGEYTALVISEPGDLSDEIAIDYLQHSALAGLWHSRAETAGLALEGAMATLEENVLSAGYFVATYLRLIGETHRFMQYLDNHGIPYDPRLPEALIGESVAQMRQLFTSTWTGNVGNAARVEQELRQYQAVGGPSVDDLWTARRTFEPLPEQLIPAGTLEESERAEKFYEVLRGATVLGVPRYDAGDEAAEGLTPSERRLAATGLASNEAQKMWLRWRNYHLAGIAAGYGLIEPGDVFLRDYSRLGSGEITAWPMGPLPPAQRAADLVGERSWLAARP